MKPVMIDLGWAMARISLTTLDTEQPGIRKIVPQLTICWPGDESQSSGAIELWDLDGLHNLRDALGQFLDKYDEELAEERRQEM